MAFRLKSSGDAKPARISVSERVCQRYPRAAIGTERLSFLKALPMSKACQPQLTDTDTALDKRSIANRAGDLYEIGGQSTTPSLRESSQERKRRRTNNENWRT